MAPVPLRQLRVVAAVAQHGGATQAAAALHQSVSAVTRAVKHAERELGLPLFERGARGMACTPAGQVLVPRVLRALAELQKAGERRAERGGDRRSHPIGEATLPLRATDAMLQALAVVAATRSEGAAALQLGVSQPAVHQALLQLEHAAREPLFERSRRGTRLTEAGENLLQRVKLALHELRIAHDELAAFRGHAPGRVALGALPMAADVLVPQALSRLFTTLPGLRVTVVDGTYEALQQQLRHGDIDLIVGPLRGSAAAADLLESLLFVDHLLPVVRRDHPALQAPRPPRSLRSLLRWPWVGPLSGTPARAAFERAFAAAGLDAPAVQLEANAPAVVRSVLMAGDAVAMLSPLQIRAELASGLLVLLPLPVQGTERRIGITQRRDGLASAACRELLSALRAAAAASQS